IRFSVLQRASGEKVGPGCMQTNIVSKGIDSLVDSSGGHLEKCIRFLAVEGQRAAIEDQFQVGDRSFARGVELVGSLHLDLTRADELKLLPLVGDDFRLYVVIN